MRATSQFPDGEARLDDARCPEKSPHSWICKAEMPNSTESQTLKVCDKDTVKVEEHVSKTKEPSLMKTVRH